MLDEAVDTNDGDVSKITSADYRKIVDLCWQCKLCYNHCPYTPPHAWDIDFPRLMLRAKAARAKAEGVTRQDAWLGNVDARRRPRLRHGAPQQLGQRVRTPTACSSRPRSGSTGPRNLPKFHHKTFARWFRAAGGGPEPEGPTVAFFFSCSVNYNEPQVGRDAVSVLERNGCAVSCPEQVCCGMPYLDGGDIEAAAPRTPGTQPGGAAAPGGAGREGGRAPAHLLVRPQEGVPDAGPRRERPEKVAAATQDFFEYLAGRKQGRDPGHGVSRARARARSPTRCPATCAPRTWASRPATCSSSSPAPRCRVVEKCTAMDGTWGMKKEYYPISLQYARKAVDRRWTAAAPETYATDCTLSALQIEAVRGQKPAAPDHASCARPTACPRSADAMKKIESPSSWTSTDYEKAREAMRADIIELKKNRRVSVGDRTSPCSSRTARPCSSRSRRWCARSASWTTTRSRTRVDAYNALMPRRRRALGHPLHRDPRASRAMSHDEADRGGQPVPGARSGRRLPRPRAACAFPPVSRRGGPRRRRWRPCTTCVSPCPEEAVRTLGDPVRPGPPGGRPPELRGGAVLGLLGLGRSSLRDLD